MKSLKTWALLLGLSSAAFAQVPHGNAIVSNFTNVAPMQGVLLVNRAGVATPITGLPASARASGEINSIQLDPCDNRVWIGGISPAIGRIDTFTVNGTAIANFTTVGNTGNGGSVSGIAFDANGNAICSSGAMTGTGGLFRVDRKTNAVTRILGGAGWTGQVGTCNGVCSDDVGNLYFCITGAPASVYQLAPGPNGTYPGPATLVGTVSPPSSSATISSVEYAPANGARPARIWWTTFGTAGTAVGYIQGGVATPQGPLGGNSAPNWIDYDALNDDFWLVTGGIDPDTVYTVDHLGNPTQVALVPPGGVNGSPSAIDANDVILGNTTVLPQYVTGGPVDVEVCTACPNGQIGGVLMVSPIVFVLSTGTAGPDARIFQKFPNVVVPQGTPGSIVMQAFCFDPATSRLTLGAPVRWPRN